MAKATIELTNNTKIIVEGATQDVLDTLEKIKLAFNLEGEKEKRAPYSEVKTEYYNTLCEIDNGDNGSMFVYVTPEEYHRINY